MTDQPSWEELLQAHLNDGGISEESFLAGYASRDAEVHDLKVRIEQHRGTLGYSVSGDIPQDNDIQCGICDAQRKELAAKDAKLAIAEEALKYYAKGGDRTTQRQEFGCGCCAGIYKGRNEWGDWDELDYDRDAQGLTAREALAKMRGEK